MKIYNKKSFAEGAFMSALATFNLIMDLVDHTFEINGAVLSLALYFFGGGLIIRSFSLKFTKEDILDKMDERNQLIELKSKSKSFMITQTISFLLMLAFLVMGKVYDYDGFISMGVGLALAFAVSMFVEIFTYMYYEYKN